MSDRVPRAMKGPARTGLGIAAGRVVDDADGLVGGRIVGDGERAAPVVRVAVALRRGCSGDAAAAGRFLSRGANTGNDRGETDMQSSAELGLAPPAGTGRRRGGTVPWLEC